MERDPRVGPRKGDIVTDSYEAYAVLRSEDDCVEYIDVEEIQDRAHGHLITLARWRESSKKDTVLWPREDK